MNIDNHTSLWEIWNDIVCEVVKSFRGFLYFCNRKIIKLFELSPRTVERFSNGDMKDIDKYTTLWEIQYDRFCEDV